MKISYTLSIRRFLSLTIALLHVIFFMRGAQPESLKDDLFCPGCNVLILDLSNVRKDHLSVYGYSRDTSPHLKRLAERSFVFTRAYSPADWTLPAATSLLTSLYPIEHGVVERIENGGGALSGEITTLADLMKARGYATLAFTGGFDLHPAYGVSSRFEVSDHEDQALAGIRSRDQMSLSVGSLRNSIDKMISWLKANKSKKFFGYLQSFDAHCPFGKPQISAEFAKGLKSSLDPNKCYWTAREQKDEGTAPGLIPVLSTGSTPADLLPAAVVSPEDLQYLIALYDGEVKLIDGYIGKLLASLEDLGLTQKTIVIVTSGHGDLLGEKGQLMRGGAFQNSQDEVVLNIPLIIYHPKINSSAGRLVRGSLVSLLDIAPTVVRLLGGQIPTQFRGLSLEPLMKSDTPVHDAVFASVPHFPVVRGAISRPASIMATVISGEWKFSRQRKIPREISLQAESLDKNFFDEVDGVTTVERLYNLNSDPLELSDQLQTKKDQADGLRELLKSHFKSMRSSRE